MLFASSLVGAAVLPLVSLVSAGPVTPSNALLRRDDASTSSNSPGAPSKTPAQVCTLLASQLPSNEVFLPGSTQYASLITHQYNSSVQNPACVVEPATSGDVSTIMKALNTYLPPWAVEGSGHNANPGFASTTGIHIRMLKFNAVTVHQNAGTVDVSPGLSFDKVYTALNGTGLGVPGARAAGPGVAGVTLGGGWSWVANEQGLGIDKLASIEVVVPNGTVITTSQNSHPDLFFAMRGGGNKFGIATKFTFNTYPQGNVYAGTIIVGGDGNTTLINQCGSVLAQWAATNTDPKATMQMAIFYTATGNPAAHFFIMYNAPTAPAGIFHLVEALPHTVDTRAPNIPFATWVASQVIPGAPRAGLAGLGVSHWTPAFVQACITSANAVVNQAKAAGKANFTLHMFLEPYMAVYATHSKGGAYPHDSSDPASPLGLNWTWGNSTDDAYFQNIIITQANALGATGRAIGAIKPTTAIYSNYANYAQPVSQIYQGNLARLQAIKAANDPRGVMDKAGWFSI